MNTEARNCQNCKKDFVIEPEDFNFYEKIKVPPPTFCSECRNQRRMSWRNERSLHRVNCAAPRHSEQILSMYDSSQSYVVFDNKYWWSDEWNPLEYGFLYDFKQPFFQQFAKLLKTVPLAALSTINSVNSEYTNFVDGNKNCYLLFGSGWNENIRYGNKLFMCKDSQDLFMCTKCELSYECVECIECYRLMWSINCRGCTDSYFLYNCRNCTNCFGCTNLVNKSYCMWNVQYTKEEYNEKLNKLMLGQRENISSLRNKFHKICLSTIHRYANIFSSINSTGNNINQGKNCTNCFDIYQGVEDSKYLYSALDLKDCYDSNGVFKNQLSVECLDCNIGNKNLSSITTYNSNEARYCFNCHDVKNCFGCVGLRKKQYCIFNKQYSKKEYEKLVSKIVEHMSNMPYVDSKGRGYVYGDFMPIELSPFAYNETIAQDYYPMTQNEVKNRKYRWRTQEERNYTLDIKSIDIPNDIFMVGDEIIGKILECAHHGTCDEKCTEAFQIIESEFSFYKRLNISLPVMCPNCRHSNRLKQRNPLKLWHRQCMCDKPNHQHDSRCKNEFETSYAPDRPEIVCCEKCYQAEVY